jgi:predicted ester cyclase
MGDMSEGNKRIASRVVEEMLSQNPALASELYDASLVPKVAKLAETLLAAFPDLEIKVEDLIAEGDKVACRWKARGTQRGPFLGIPPTNAQVTFTGTSIERIQGGKIVETKTNWDSFELIQQLHAAAKGAP